ncbi:unnamed protein product, partial [Thlaspi arvense]
MFLNPTRPVWPAFSSSKTLCSDANSMEQLLLHCANAIESNDATLAQQIIWVLNNLASPDGDSTQRLASSFLRALISRAATKSPALAFLSVASASQKTLHRFSVIELASFVDLTPWHRFGFIAANAAILDAVEGSSSVHIVDLTLIVNCHMMLHYIPDETLTSSGHPSPRSVFLKELRDLNPTMVTLVEEDADFTSTNFISRLRSLFNYMWIPYDTADTFLTRGSEQRRWYEADIGWKIDNVIAKEGVERVERLERKSRWFERMREAKFGGVGFGETAATEAKTMLEEHAAGWGMKRDVDDDDDVDRFVLTWKGHSVVFASAWVPINGVDESYIEA